VADREQLVLGYAEAIDAVAGAEGVADLVEDELYRFGKVVEQQPELREALSDPALPEDRRKAILTQLLGERAHPTTVRLLGFLIEQGRIKDLTKIVTALAERAAARRRKAVAEVRAAVPLDEGQRTRLAEALSAATGKDVELKVLIDPSVIGGVVARVGDEVIDGTVRRKLELARQQMARAR
jgi:F-type H+-transporting ATPase subunit delta